MACCTEYATPSAIARWRGTSLRLYAVEPVVVLIAPKIPAATRSHGKVQSTSQAFCRICPSEFVSFTVRCHNWEPVFTSYPRTIEIWLSYPDIGRVSTETTSTPAVGNIFVTVTFVAFHARFHLPR